VNVKVSDFVFHFVTENFALRRRTSVACEIETTWLTPVLFWRGTSPSLIFPKAFL
jgi:hypothetical protein